MSPEYPPDWYPNPDDPSIEWYWDGQGWTGSRPAGAGTPAGWYPDPSPPGQRYWDGAAWTEDVAPGYRARQPWAHAEAVSLVVGLVVVAAADSISDAIGVSENFLLSLAVLAVVAGAIGFVWGSFQGRAAREAPTGQPHDIGS